MAENPIHAMLIEELRDVDAPEAPSVWPPAPGWWGLGLACVCAAFLLYRVFAARRARFAYRREANSTLVQIYGEYVRDGNRRRYVRRAAELTRRIAIEMRGRERAARPTGSQFAALLGPLSERPLSDECALVLGEAAYRPQSDFDIDRLHAELVAWLEALVRDAHA